MATKKKRQRKEIRSQEASDQQQDSNDPVPVNLPVSRFQHALLIGSVTLFVVWFAYLAYVAFWK